uniref:Pr1-like protein n=1 Tax=Oryza sativa subsp. japonica TaxID=39947 RepID=Q8S835_ORYSJ|nr:Hypothetical protein [Oryza sativa Japonica Group]
MAGRGARGPGPREVGPTRQPLGPRWTGRTRLAAVGAVGPARQPHPRARAADGRAHLAAARARPKAASPARPTGAARPRPDGHRRRPSARRSSARESGEEGETEGTVHGSPRDTRTAETTNGVEKRGGAARDDDDGGAPTVGERNGGADEVDGDAAMPREVAPSREEDRSDDGGEPERRKATARFGMPRATVLRQPADEAERRTGSAATRRSGWRCRRVGRRTGATSAANRRRAGKAGCGGIRGGGGARARAGGGCGARRKTTGGSHPSARVAGGPACQRRARAGEADGPWGKRERGRDWAEPAQEGKGGEKNFF